ncbi:MAG TPA: hypothetical protein VFY29_13545 [Terriglobia bacterium]|nr:hypothetical protein [Terriglobia bacterium]
MKTYGKPVWFLAMLALALACKPGNAGQRSDPPAPQQALGQPFELKGGGTASLDGGKLTVVFEKVSGDSRCPVDVTCIWEGDATVSLRLKQADRDASSVEVHTSGRYAREVTYEKYRIRLQDLKPQPRANVPIEQKAYTATLVVSRVE